MAMARTLAASGKVVERDGIVVVAASGERLGDVIDADDDETANKTMIAIEWQ